MKGLILQNSLLGTICLLAVVGCTSVLHARQPKLYPTPGSKNINPDAPLTITFDVTPTVGNSGQIRVYEAGSDRLVDVLDLSIPAGPTKNVDHKGTPPPYLSTPYPYTSDNFTNANTKAGTPSGGALPNPDCYQLNIIGRFTDAFHFYPVMVRDNQAIITLHNNLLEYNRTYYIQVDQGVLTLPGKPFKGIRGNKQWRFSTRSEPPIITNQRITVSADGTGDFNTVQGALDFIPDHTPHRTTIFIKNGTYHEIVYFRNKHNISLVGEDREKTVVCYANNEVFNPHPINISTNEWPGTFPSRRAVFMADNARGIQLSNFTIRNQSKGQAEALLMAGSENLAYRMSIYGSGDALQTNGSAYLKECLIEGDGDTYLGRGPVFFDHCTIRSHGVFAWVRNTQANHGAVFFRCTLQATGNEETEIARAPTNKGQDYPYCEAVLLQCKLSGISNVGWGPVGGDTPHVHYWEWESTHLSDGLPVNVSQRHPVSRQLTLPNDADIIDNYSKPSFVLDGWHPKLP